MTQRHDSILSKDYMEFLVATTYLYKEQVRTIEQQIRGCNSLLDIYSKTPENSLSPEALDKINKAKDEAISLLSLMLARIYLHETEHKRLEYFMLNNCTAVGVHPELAESFYSFSYEKMKTKVTFH